ncbi:hypothetical protein QJQ45_025909 [Haematococcus lacustris]|nr:hypothetical protein QJQ45_025909 [Haematococcus lacustris]
MRVKFRGRAPSSSQRALSSLTCLRSMHAIAETRVVAPAPSSPIQPVREQSTKQLIRREPVADVTTAHHGSVTGPAALTPPTSLGWSSRFHALYNICQPTVLLGAGEYGKVLLAEHRVTGQQVAVKMIAKQRDDRTVAQHLQCIQAEVEAWSSCQGSQYVVRLEGLYEDAEHVMLVQELCSGGDLRSVLKRGQLTEFETAQVMRAVLDVVHECHSQGILYGDFLCPCSQIPFDQIARLPPAPALILRSACVGLPLAPHPVTFPKLPIQAKVLAVLSQVKPANFLLRQPHKAVSCLRFPDMPPATSPTPLSEASSQLNGQPAAEEGSAAARAQPSSPAAPFHPNNTAYSGSVASGSSSLAQVVSGALPVSLPASAASPQCGPTCPSDIVVLATDFGCAQKLHSRSRCSATAVKRMGSPVFMAPEQWQGGSLGLASDIWAAGVMMYQLLSGRFPFWADVPAEQVDGQGAGLALYKVVCAIQSNPVLLSGAPWDRVSRPCKDLLCAMLDRQPSTRISAHAALHHSWFRQQLGQVPAVRSPALQPEQSGTYDPDDYSSNKGDGIGINHMAPHLLNRQLSTEVRTSLTRFRLGNSSLEVEKARFGGVTFTQTLPTLIKAFAQPCHGHSGAGNSSHPMGALSKRAKASRANGAQGQLQQQLHAATAQQQQILMSAAAATQAELEEARSQLFSCQDVNMRTATDLQVCQEQLHQSQQALQQSENEVLAMQVSLHRSEAESAAAKEELAACMTKDTPSFQESWEALTFTDRTCTRCTEGVVDDAMHFMFECTATSSIREQPEFAMTLQNNNENLHDFMLSPCAPLFVHLAMKCVTESPEPLEGEGGLAA